MDCADCQGGSKVTSSQKSSEGVKRVRQCVDCGSRWSTHEMFHVKLKVYKKLKEKRKVVVKVQHIPSTQSVGYGRGLIDSYDDYDWD